LSTKELKAASTAFAVAQEIARKRLGKGDCVDPGILLRGMTKEQLDEFVRVCRELERGFDEITPSPEVDRGESIVQESMHYTPEMRRPTRERNGGYR
jgi:hypothetical protein